MFLSPGLSTIHLRLGPVVTFAFIIISLCLLLSGLGSEQKFRASLIELDDDLSDSPSPEEDYLERLSERYLLTNQTRWQAWRIQPSDHPDRDSPLIDVGLKFASQSQKIVDLRGPRKSDLRATKLMTLPGAARTEPATNGSDFLFGVSTSYHRLAGRNWAVLRAWTRWLTRRGGESNGAGLVIMLDRATDSQLQEVDDRLHAVGLDAYLLSTDEPMSMAKRYYEMVRIFKTYGATLAACGQRKTWFALVDDTVFFPDLSHLGRQLAAYRADDELYMGLPGGGAALLMTRRAVDRVPSLPCTDAASFFTVVPAKPQQWHELLTECVEQRAGREVRVLSYGHDDDGDDDDDDDDYHHQDATRRPLLLHHQPHHLDVGMAHLVTDVCGESCFMQRFLFRDDWLLVNGVSISHHPDGLGRHQHARRGRHLGHHRADAGFSLWRLLDSTSSPDGSVWQAYLRRADEADGMDSVIVLIWGGGVRLR
ncbi:hypothetical protein L249_3787 [Ophiocordyceps polyrhachis-furcata BCC 54312]|uniref:Glycosyltransferase family 31 protein n=1 Tax=Ophiocordyceps polyrhachis-furcata BCC 54312 TaxID=1330021 RepID=A0A367L5H3_9HYPO|nr:hypothetical protein L249_3787 [Ophiocordyceps polyrhachis-furcata BCC 54312]